VNIFLALIISLITGIMPNTQANEPISQAPASQVQEFTWEESVLYEAGLTLPDNAVLSFSDVDNCGSKLSPTGTGGGCMRTMEDGSKLILVSPQVYGTLEGEHILLHETAHALGIMNECSAEYFAHDHGSEWYMWSYPQCQLEND